MLLLLTTDGSRQSVNYGVSCELVSRAQSRDLAEIVAYPGFFHLARRHWRMGMGEMWRSWNKAAFVRALQRLMPEITAEHLDPAPAGVRAQAITPDGKLLDDFAFSETRCIVHVVNAPSPAATASLSIGEFIAGKVAERF